MKLSNGIVLIAFIVIIYVMVWGTMLLLPKYHFYVEKEKTISQIKIIEMIDKGREEHLKRVESFATEEAEEAENSKDSNGSF